MSHRKISFLLVLFLFSFCRLVAQTDTGAREQQPVSSPVIIPATKPASDTGAAPVNVPHHTNRPRKSDSSVVRTAVPGKVSSLPDSTVAAGHGNGHPVQPDSAAANAVTRQPVEPISPAETIALFRSAMGINPYFNFTAKAFIQEIEWHHSDSKDGLFYLLLGIMFYFALVRMFFEKYFDNLITLFFRVSIRAQQIREQVLQAPLPSLLLNLLFVISGGLYASWLVRYYHFAGNINFWILLINCMGALGLIYLGKFLILKFCGWVFNISRATDIYIFVVFLVNKMMGIFLLPILIILFFSGPTAQAVFVTISLSMIFIFFGYRVIASYRPIRNEIKLTPFHFFLYLCAFEIAPLLLIYKVLLIYLEKAY